MKHLLSRHCEEIWLQKTKKLETMSKVSQSEEAEQMIGTQLFKL
jgi:hypothetical protein